MPAPHHSIFYRPDALPDAQQQHQSTEGKLLNLELNSSGAMQPTEHIGFKLQAWLCSMEYASE